MFLQPVRRLHFQTPRSASFARFAYVGRLRSTSAPLCFPGASVSHTVHLGGVSLPAGGLNRPKKSRPGHVFASQTASVVLSEDEQPSSVPKQPSSVPKHFPVFKILGLVGGSLFFLASCNCAAHAGQKASNMFNSYIILFCVACVCAIPLPYFSPYPFLMQAAAVVTGPLSGVTVSDILSTITTIVTVIVVPGLVWFGKAMFARMDKADANNTKTNAKMDTNSTKTNAKIDANNTKTNAKMDTNSTKTNAKIDANNTKTNAKIDGLCEKIDRFLATMHQVEVTAVKEQSESEARTNRNIHLALAGKPLLPPKKKKKKKNAMDAAVPRKNNKQKSSANPLTNA